MKEWEVRLILFLLMIYLTSLFCYWTWEAKAPIKISEFPVSSVSFCTLRGKVSFKTSICCILAFFFYPNSSERIQSQFPAFVIFHTYKTHMLSYTRTEREADLRWLAHLGEDAQDVLRLLVFARFWLWSLQMHVSGFYLGPGLVRYSRSERAEFLKVYLEAGGRNCNGVGKKKAPRSCENTTKTHTLAADFERWLQVTAHLDFHLSKACLLWLTRAEPQRNRLPRQKMDAARSAAVRKAWQLWPGATPEDLEGNWCYTEVAIWYEALEKCHFVSRYGGRMESSLP